MRQEKPTGRNSARNLQSQKVPEMLSKSEQQKSNPQIRTPTANQRSGVPNANPLAPKSQGVPAKEQPYDPLKKAVG